MQKITKSIVPRNPACTPYQVYLLGTRNPDGTPLFLTHASACFIPGPPEGMVVGVMASEQPRTAENILREQAFSLNHCNVAMRGLADSAWYERAPGANEEGMAFYRGACDTPILDASPHALECQVLQSTRAGETVIFVTAIAHVHADDRWISPYPASGDSYGWYASQDVKKLDPLLYAFHYYTVSESIGRIGIKF
jgi:flavin reductase (DIM6/NTAB) family NADH-FMN oxidoreductase RutF